MEVTTSFGIRLRKLRKEKGWTIEDLAFEANINRNYIGDLERGLRNPTLKILEKIANALNITISELCEEI